MRQIEEVRERAMQLGGQPVRVSAFDREVTILAVDDQEPFRDALRELIAATPGCVLVGEAHSGEEAVRAVESLSPQLVLMDIGMPGMGGIAATRAIKQAHPETVVVLVSVDDPAVYPGASALGDTVACVRKQDLRPRTLREWCGMRNR